MHYCNFLFYFRAYKLGRGRWSYNEVDLIIQSGKEVLQVQEVAMAAGARHDAGASQLGEGSRNAVVSERSIFPSACMHLEGDTQQSACTCALMT